MSEQKLENVNSAADAQSLLNVGLGDPTPAWNAGCEAYYMGIPVFYNPYRDHGQDRYIHDKYIDWESGWEYAWESCGKPPHG